MRLCRLSLRNWRGVDACDVQFAAGVTLIEGPNEVGKSTIVEALRMLFNEMDSSNKRAVKAIQPVGQDVPREYVPTGICAHGNLCPRESVPTGICAHGNLCPRESVPTGICAHVFWESVPS